MPVLSLACIQLISAFIGLCIAVKFQLLVPKKVDLKLVATPVILFASLTAFGAYSIDYNNLFSSQILKFFQIPFLFAINGVLNRNFSSNQIKLSVVD